MAKDTNNNTRSYYSINELIQKVSQHFLVPVTVLSLLLTTALILLIIWGTNKGVDFTDQGYHLLKYQDHQEYFASFSYFHEIIRKLFGWMNPTILNTRILRLSLTVSTSIIFATGFINWLKHTYKIAIKPIDALLIICFTLLGSLLSYTFGPQSLSYNHLTTFCVLLSTGILFYALNPNINIIIRAALVFLTGVITGIAAFIKITSAIPFLAAITIYFLINSRETTQKKAWKFLISLYTGFLTFIGIYLLWMADLEEFTRNFQVITQTSTMSATDHTLMFYLKDFVKTLLRIMAFLLFGTLVVFALHALRVLTQHILSFQQRTGIKRCLGLAGIFLALIIAAGFLHKHILYLDFSGPYLMITVIPFCIFLFNKLIRKMHLQRTKKLWSTLGLLFILPFIGAFGTNNGLIINAIFFVPAWFTAILSFHYGKLVSKQIIGGLVIVLLIMIGVKFPHDYLTDTYRQAPLIQQTKLIDNLPNGQHIRVDPSTKGYLDQIYAILKENGFTTHDPIIGTYKIPGIIYLVDGTAPGSVIWDNERTDQYLESLKYSTKNLKKSIFIVQDPPSEKLLEGLKDYEIDFPENYLLKGTVKSKRYPDTRIYFPEQ